MRMPDVLNSKSIKIFIRGTFVLIGLFFVLSCVVAVFLICFDKDIENIKKIEVSKNPDSSTDSSTVQSNNYKVVKRIEITKNINNKVCALIKILIIPLIVLLIFLLIILLIIFLIFACLTKSYFVSSYIEYIGTLLIEQKKEESPQKEQEKEESPQKEQNKQEKLIEMYKSKMNKIKDIIEACNMVIKAIKPVAEEDEKKFLELFSGITKNITEKCPEADSCNNDVS